MAHYYISDFLFQASKDGREQDAANNPAGTAARRRIAKIPTTLLQSRLRIDAVQLYLHIRGHPLLLHSSQLFLLKACSNRKSTLSGSFMSHAARPLPLSQHLRGMVLGSSQRMSVTGLEDHLFLC